MLKQIVEITIINDCRNCPHYDFVEKCDAGEIFRCEASEKKETRLIPRSRGNHDWLFIHPYCKLEDKK